jgi:hypothetical protein
MLFRWFFDPFSLHTRAIICGAQQAEEHLVIFHLLGVCESSSLHQFEYALI